MAVAGLVVLLALGGGCQYATARLHDAADCIATSVTVGPGFMMDAQATWLARAGGGYLKGQRHALYYGKPTSAQTESAVVSLPFLLGFERTDYRWEDSLWQVFLGVPFVVTSSGTQVLNPMLTPAHSHHTPDYAIVARENCGNYLADVGFAVHLGYLGVEFRLRLAELIDFLVGFTTLDISGDDEREKIRKASGLADPDTAEP